MVGRIITVVSVSFILFTTAIYEVIYVNKLLDKLEHDVEIIYEQIIDNPDDITLALDNIKSSGKNWDSDAERLCIIYNHKDLIYLTDTFTRLQSSVSINDYNNAIIEADLLLKYSKKVRHILGFNWHNLL